MNTSFNGKDLSGLTLLHKNELVLNNKQIKKLKEKCKMSTPTKSSYEYAKGIVKQYEDRQKQLKGLERELSNKINLFQSVNFRVDKKKGSVTFAGNKDGRTLIGSSQCGEHDKFELVIGKLIAIKKALKEDFEDVVKLVEEKGNIYFEGNTLHLKGGVLSSTYTSTSQLVDKAAANTWSLANK